MIEFGLNWALSTNFYESMEKWDLSFIFIPIFKFWTIQLHKSTVSWLKTASMCLLVREDSFGKDLGDYRNKLEWSTVPVWLLWKVHCSNFGWRHLPTKAFAPNPCWPICLKLLQYQQVHSSYYSTSKYIGRDPSYEMIRSSSTLRNAGI